MQIYECCRACGSEENSDSCVPNTANNEMKGKRFGRAGENRGAVPRDGRTVIGSGLQIILQQIDRAGFGWVEGQYLRCGPGPARKGADRWW